MAQSFKNPPVLQNDCIYGDWKSELEIWRHLTDVWKKTDASGNAEFIVWTG